MVAVWDERWLARRYYGGELPTAAERALHEAARQDHPDDHD